MSQSLVFNGHAIRVEGEMTCLTDMWQAGGAVDAQRPGDWRVLPSTKAFVGFLEETDAVKSGNESFRVVRDGGNVATFAHWQIALAYAKYLSPAFHAWCNTVVRNHMEAPKPLALPSRTESLRLALEASERADRLEAEVKELAPKAEALDRLTDAKGLYGIDELAKMLSTGQNRMFQWLREKRILKSDNTPYQEYATDHFHLKSTPYAKPDGSTHLSSRTYATAKGVAYVAKRFVVEGMKTLGSGASQGEDAEGEIR